MQLPALQNQTLFKQALTHRSYHYEHPHSSKDNERLEFLGDAVLGFVVAELLYQRYPERDEAQLTQMRSALVDQKQLAELAQNLGIGKLVRLGAGAEQSGGRQNPSILSDCFEAIIGAYFLDAGISRVQEYIADLFLPLAEQMDWQTPQSLNDPKNRLQEWTARNFKINPDYQVTSESGPDHNKQFTVQVSINGKVYGYGKGSRKKEAEKQAAIEALSKIETNQ